MNADMKCSWLMTTHGVREYGEDGGSGGQPTMAQGNPIRTSPGDTAQETADDGRTDSSSRMTGQELTFDEENLEDMEDEQQREEGVAVDVEGVGPFDVLFDCMRGLDSQEPIADVPQC